MSRRAMFDAVRPFAPGGRLTPEMVKAGDALADALGLARETVAASGGTGGVIPVAPSEPPWLIEARKHVGTREIVGPRHSPVIMGWIREIGASILGVPVNDDETPWCGTFMALVMKRSGIQPPKIAVRASQWGRAGKWGRELLGPRLGCVLVFTRNGGGHVGLYVGEDATHFHVLGGNQSNSVNVMRLAKTRLAEGGMRWPAGIELPPQRAVHLTAGGAPVSGNEA